MKQLHMIGPLLQLGWVVAFSTLIPLGIGLWLDRRFGAAPLFTLIGALVGIVAGTYGTVRIAVRTIDALGRAADARSDTQTETSGKEDNA